MEHHSEVFWEGAVSERLGGALQPPNVQDVLFQSWPRFFFITAISLSERSVFLYVVKLNKNANWGTEYWNIYAGELLLRIDPMCGYRQTELLNTGNWDLKPTLFPVCCVWFLHNRTDLKAQHLLHKL